MLVPHTWRGLFRSMCVAVLAALLTLTTTSYVFAHEGRKVHGYELDVGFLTEPVYEGQPNAVYLSVARADTGHHEKADGSAGHQHHDHSMAAHAAIFTSAPIEPGGTFKWDVSEDYVGQVIPWHSHLDPKLAGTLHVMMGEVGQIDIALQKDGATPIDVQVSPGAVVVWTNGTDVLQTVTSGVHDGGLSHGHGQGEATTDHPHVGVEGLSASLAVDVTHVESGVQTRMSLQPHAGKAGAYVAPFVPTVPGRYQFRFVGMIGEHNVDEVFTSGPTTFDDVQSQAVLQFPVTLPTVRELSSVSKASRQEIRDASDVGSRSFIVGFAGLLFGMAGLVVGTIALTVTMRGRRA